MKQVALVVGGSGMLAGFCEELAKEYETVGVIGRTKSKMKSLLHINNIVPIYVDYSNSNELEDRLKAFTTEYGKPSLVVAWVHSYAASALGLIAKYCRADYYIISGLSGENQALMSNRQRQNDTSHVKYHFVTLGKSGDRWLTDDEICEGVAQAVKTHAPEFIVGNL